MAWQWRRKTRKRRKPAQRPPRSPAPRRRARYERSRARDEAARAALKPLRPGQRPTAVTVGAVAAAVIGLANLIALVLGYNPSEDTLSPGSRLSGGIVTTGLLALVAYGMWRARYWAVLGMQTLLALTIVFCSLALVQAVNLWAFVLVSVMLVASGDAVLVPRQGDGAHPDAGAARVSSAPGSPAPVR